MAEMPKAKSPWSVRSFKGDGERERRSCTEDPDPKVSSECPAFVGSKGPAHLRYLFCWKRVRD
jgi:hypothetical protein